MPNPYCDRQHCGLRKISSGFCLSLLPILLLFCACRGIAPQQPDSICAWQRQHPGLAARLANDARPQQRILLAPAPVFFGALPPPEANLPADQETDYGPAQGDIEAYLQYWHQLCQDKLPPSLPPPLPDAALLPPAAWRKVFSQQDYQNGVVHLYQAMRRPGLNQQQRTQLQCLALFQQQQQLLSLALNDLAKLNRGQADNFPAMVDNLHRLQQFQQQFAALLSEHILPELCSAATAFLQPLLPLLQHPDCGQPQSALLSLWMAVPAQPQQALPLHSRDSADWRALHPTPFRYAALDEPDGGVTPPASHTWLVMSFAAPAPPPGKICQLAILPLPADSEVYFQGQAVAFQPAQPLFIALPSPERPDQEFLLAIKFSAPELGRQICPPWICAKDAPADATNRAVN
ncbi:MAG: hypothetical protein GX564_08810 [Oligosphaeraceae bacterium]|jgi:hypothetical protein|nr:hypothetical protein [Oligosphaeraceae bacterium]